MLVAKQYTLTPLWNTNLWPKILNKANRSQPRISLAKHKKRKSTPTPDPKDSTKKDLPETEKVPSTSNTDKKPEIEKNEKDYSKPNETSVVIRKN